MEPAHLPWRGVLSLILFVILVAAAIGFVRWNPNAEPLPRRGQLVIGWSDSFPYQFTVNERGYLHREGLALKILERTLDGMGYTSQYRDMDWKDQLPALQDGTLMATTMATQTPERDAYAWFSDPYLQEHFGAFLRRGLETPSGSLVSLRQWARQQKMVVGATEKFAYPSEIQAIVEDARQDGRLNEVVQDVENLERLATQDCDIAFLDETMAFASIKQAHLQGSVAYCGLDVAPIELRVMFSRTAVSPKVVEEFNRSLASLKASGEYARLHRSFAYPRLLYSVTGHPLFRLMTVSAAMFAGLTGLLIARRERYDFIGALALASCPAVGGGILRDLVASRNPLAVVADPVNLVGITILVISGGLFFRLAPVAWREHIERLDPSRDRRLLLFDSLGLAAYTVLAVFTAMQCSLEPLWLWGPLLAVVQNGGGGILRDLLAGRGGQIAILKGTIYGEIAAFWALLLALYLLYDSTHGQMRVEVIMTAITLTALGVLMTRAVILWKGWRSPPL